MFIYLIYLFTYLLLPSSSSYIFHVHLGERGLPDTKLVINYVARLKSSTYHFPHKELNIPFPTQRAQHTISHAKSSTYPFPQEELNIPFPTRRAQHTLSHKKSSTYPFPQEELNIPFPT